MLDSPLLRRPDLLRSMVGFWQNHPSLSYLFSGMYVGPTSQYPRVDEARMDALYELEVAFSQLPSSDCPPFIVDGLFRNLLVDVTGNSHRAEFCIDKLYPPEGWDCDLACSNCVPSKWLRMSNGSCGDAVDPRALVCMFWKKPYSKAAWSAGAPRCMTDLCCRILCRRDFSDVLSLVARGPAYDFEEKWFAAHLEFRFPKIGSIRCRGSRTRTASGARALECACGRDQLRPNGSQRGLVSRADSGEVVGVHDRIPIRGCVQWAQGAAAPHGVSLERR